MSKKININNIKNIIENERLPREIQKIVYRLNNIREKITEEDILYVVNTYKTMDECDIEKAKEYVLAYYFPIAIIIGKRYAKYVPTDYIEDLYQVAFNTIINCLERYEPTNKVKFHTYLSTSIKGEIIKFIDATKTIKYSYYYLKTKYEDQDDFHNIISMLKVDTFSQLSTNENAENISIENYLSESKNKVDFHEQFKKKMLYDLVEAIKEILQELDYTDMEKDIIYKYLFSEERFDASTLTKMYNIKQQKFVYNLVKKFFNELRKRLLSDEKYSWVRTWLSEK